MKEDARLYAVKLRDELNDVRLSGAGSDPEDLLVHAGEITHFATKLSDALVALAGGRPRRKGVAMIFDFVADYIGIKLVKITKERKAARRRVPPRPDLRDAQDVRREDVEAENDEIDFEFYRMESDARDRERLRELHRGRPRRSLTGGGWSV